MPLDKFVDSEIVGLYGGQAKILSRSLININAGLGYMMIYSASPPSLYLLFLKDADNVVKSFNFLNSSE